MSIKTEALSLSRIELEALAPYLSVFVGSLAGIALSVQNLLSKKWMAAFAALSGLAAGGYLSAGQLAAEPVRIFSGMLVVDPFSAFFNLVFAGCGIVTVLSSLAYLDKENLQYPEYYVLSTLACVGMMLMASSAELITLFISLEIMSLAVYVLVGFRRADRKSNEAAVKYFILGSAASAVLLYGVALVYGATGSTVLPVVLETLRNRPEVMSPVFALGSALLAIGFMFKVASIPFHMWLPDVYEGAPSPITGFMATGIKAASFAALLRVLGQIGYGGGMSDLLQGHLREVLWVSAAATMLLGNLVALTQTNLKRMLAYSSIAHTGYLLVGLLVGPGGSPQGWAPVVIYLATYAIMNLGAFAVLSVLSSRGDAGLNLHDLAGLSRRHPFLALAMAIFLFSMAGIPPTAGFVSKYLLFYSAVQAGEAPLVVIAVLCSAISVYYYLRVLVTMYMREPASDAPRSAVALGAGVSVLVAAAVTLQFGVAPAGLIEAARKAIQWNG